MSTFTESVPTLPPDGVNGKWSVQSFTVTEEESLFTRMRAIQHPEEYVPPGTYKRLVRNGVVIMSTTPMEYRTNSTIINRAKGTVLINGLGLGVVLAAIIPKVERVVVVELDAELIALVGNHFSSPKCTIVHADAMTYTPPKGQRYNAVWHDIWDNICEDNLVEMTRLKMKYGRRSDWQGCWSEGMLRR